MPSLRSIALAALASMIGPVAAAAHPHVFVEPHIDVSISPDGHLQSLRNVWRMDAMFSSSVVVDFDANGDGKLEPDELAAIGKQVRGSIERWSFYTDVRKGGAAVAMTAAPVLGVSWDTKGGQLVFDLPMKPAAPLDVKGGDVTVSNFDQTYFVAFDFKDTRNLTIHGSAANCRADMSAPSPDDAAKSWMATIAAIPADADVPADGIKFSEVLSTKYRIHCGKG